MSLVLMTICCVLLTFAPAITMAQGTGVGGASSMTGTNVTAANAVISIPVGTIITAQNWNRYKDFMPDGMLKLFAGEYSLKIPSDVQMEIGSTIIHPIPKGYLEATEKYSGQVNLIELPDGGLTLQGYQGGAPFPHPADPHKGWKILANLWYRYMPHLTVDTHGSGCVTNNGSGINCKIANIVEQQLAYVTDPGVPATIPGAGDKFYSQWLMVTAPEQNRYTATLTISYQDLAREEDSYIFLPALRRYQRLSTLARCSPNQGTDSTQEEYRAGFDSNLTQLKVDFIGDKKIVMLLPSVMPSGQFPADFDMPLGWPKPSWGKWQLRDVDVISASKLPAHAQGYCYGKRVMYVDRATSAPLWEDLYDAQIRLWRIYAMFLNPREVPNVGVVDVSGAMVYAFWDVQNTHATFFTDPSEGQPFYINEQAPKEYLDLKRYTEASGLNLIMR
jgi:hypothetical protein